MNINDLNLVENTDTNVSEFYKVRWISPFDDKDERYVEPGITAINKLYKKVIYKGQPYVVSNKTYENLSYLQEYAKLETIKFNITNTDDYISKPKLQNIKPKELNDSQLTTIYLYQSEFYYKYWNEQRRQITLHTKSTMQSTYLEYLEYLENYEYFIEIKSDSDYNHKIIIAFKENYYKIIILKGNVKICDSIYSIKWTTKFNIANKDIRKYITDVVNNQKNYLENFYYYAADFSYPKLNKYKNLKKVKKVSSQPNEPNEPNEQNICKIPPKFANYFKKYYNDRTKYIIAKNELAKYIYNKTKKQPFITYFKFDEDEDEIFEPDPNVVVFYRGMNLPKGNTEILNERPLISITRNKMVAIGFMKMDRQLPEGNLHILYEITLEKGVPFIDFNILGKNTLHYEEELLLLTEPCVFKYNAVSQTTAHGRTYNICKVSISANELLQYKFKHIPDIKRFKELKFDISSLSDKVKILTALNKSSSSFNISSSTSSINSAYKSRNNVRT